MESDSQMGEANKKGKGYFSWTTQMDQVLSACFLDQMNKGNKLDGKFAWKSESWTSAINYVKDQLGILVTKQNIQSRLKTWEKHYLIVSPMLLISGFSWDYSKGRVEVTEEMVRNDYVQAHPKAIPYRRKIVIDNWDDVCALFAQDRADGGDAQTEVEADIEMTTNEESNTLEDTFGTDERCLEDDATHTSGGKNQEGKSNASSSSNSRTKKRKQGGSDIGVVLGHMADSLDWYLNSEPPKPTGQQVLDEVSKVQDLDQTQVLKAFDLLMNDQRKFDGFSALPNDLKRQWILMHLG